MCLCHIVNDQNVDHLTALENNGKHVDTFTADVVRYTFVAQRQKKFSLMRADACW